MANSKVEVERSTKRYTTERRQVVRKEIMALVKQGLSTDKIAEVLTDRRIYRPNGEAYSMTHVRNQLSSMRQQAKRKKDASKSGASVKKRKSSKLDPTTYEQRILSFFEATQNEPKRRSAIVGSIRGSSSSLYAAILSLEQSGILVLDANHQLSCAPVVFRGAESSKPQPSPRRTPPLARVSPPVSQLPILGSAPGIMGTLRTILDNASIPAEDKLMIVRQLLKI